MIWEMVGVPADRMLDKNIEEGEVIYRMALEAGLASGKYKVKE